MDKQKMTNILAGKGEVATGLKLLALLTAGAASGGCVTTPPTLGISEETRAALAETLSLSSEGGSTETASDSGQQGGQGNQGQ
jgi:hypothetical protein